MGLYIFRPDTTAKTKIITTIKASEINIISLVIVIPQYKLLRSVSSVNSQFIISDLSDMDNICFLSVFISMYPI